MREKLPTAPAERNDFGKTSLALLRMSPHIAGTLGPDLYRLGAGHLALLQMSERRSLIYAFNHSRRGPRARARRPSVR